MLCTHTCVHVCGHVLTFQGDGTTQTKADGVKDPDNNHSYLELTVSFLTLHLY